ncbi:MAG: hypothetical protein NZ523_03920 [Elioraea sp.]|nr:hypothetical protein [Elioraea sp.]MDW8444272.1 hypothetical protein [Acetobacteraceae bacterium]
MAAVEPGLEERSGRRGPPAGGVRLRGRAAALRHDRRGTSALEYAALGGGIVVVIVVAISGLGRAVWGLFNEVVGNWPAP